MSLLLAFWSFSLYCASFPSQSMIWMSVFEDVFQIRCRSWTLKAVEISLCQPGEGHPHSLKKPTSMRKNGVPMLSVQPKGKQKGCAGCNRKIKDRYLLKALDKYWHEDCLKCACCDCRLGEVGSTLYTKANLILCRRDYLRLFGTTGNCAACSKLIPAFEMVMRARDNVYHLDCFACQLCNQRFCVGDKFFLKNNMILCQMDYEEGQLNGSFESQVQ
ncbi:rhombotin-1 isoform X3 [Cuculus canorus]|uniref:rhombotin-1 isoform X3 n=1 Tax=Cuculus canorus TaxID=55661 RepID=UPI0023AB1003|nr:rhombotin-1 isoform X3 [Cuculus canorus]